MAAVDQKQFTASAIELEKRLSRQFISPKTLLCRMSLLDESSKLTGAYQDPNYLPFYFHLGRVFNSRKIFCIGAELGLQMGCLLQGCSEPECVFSIQIPSESFYSPRVAISNIKSFVGKSFPAHVSLCELNDEYIDELRSKKFDSCFITVALPCDTMMDSLDLCWSLLMGGGLLCVDRLDDPRRESILKDFCKARTVEPIFFKTRYTTAIVEK